MSDTRTRESHTRDLYQAFVTGDFSGLEPHLDPRVEYVNPVDAVEAGTRFGPSAFIGALHRLHDMFDYDGFEIVEFVDRVDDSLITVRFLSRGRASAVPLDAEFVHVFTWRNGLVTRLEWFRDREEALAALD